MTSDYLGKLWKEIKENLKATIPAHSYTMWIEPLYQVPSETHGKLVIACANDFAYNRVNGNFLPMIAELARDTKVKLVTIKDIPKVLRYLPTWAKDVWGVPSAIIRSPLFSILQRRGERKYVKDFKIASWGKVEMYYTGELLDQADLEVLMEGCQLSSALKIALGEPVPFKRKTFLKEIGKAKASKKWLLSVFERLQHGQIKIKIDGVTYVISLIQSFMYDDDENSYAFILDDKIHILFGKDYTWIDKETRKELSGNLIKWLHGYICSHRSTKNDPHEIGFDKLHRLSGSQQDLSRFKYKVVKAMEALKEAGLVDFIIKPNNKNVLMFYRLDK